MIKIYRLMFNLAILALLPWALFTQESRPKYALVIGNGAYTGLAPLVNAVNDANDIAAVLGYLGFSVDRVINGTLEEMEAAIMGFISSLRTAENSYSFFFYAGHGVQSNGENYLIPVNARIPSENYLRNRATSVQTLLDDLDDAQNDLNVVVLDACRDNPFGWNRSGSRGLAAAISQPVNSIVVYSTGAGTSASDGKGRNGLFTSKLINNLATPEIEVTEVFRRTGQEVASSSYNQQVPAVYSQFFGIAFLGDTPVDFERYTPAPPGATIIIGETEKREKDPSKLWSIGASIGTCFVEPWVIATASGTIAPFKYSFLEIGVDFGFVSGLPNINYYSFCPFAHAAFYWPFSEKTSAANTIGAYIGAGGGYMMANYTFPNGVLKKNGFAFDAIVGINLFNIIDMSYTLRTNIKNANVINKISLGFTYRF